jgi:hypothetical protein
MVRLLLNVYPTPAAVLRSTRDADTAVDSVAVVGPLIDELVARDFVKSGGNILVKPSGLGVDELEVNVLLAEDRSRPGLSTLTVNGVGQVDTLPELGFALAKPPVVIDVEARLVDHSTITYRTRVPDLEAATVLKAHAWDSRKAAKDLADLHTLLEIRQAHRELDWRLHEGPLRGRRLDAARILEGLRLRIVDRNPGFEIPAYLAPPRLAALLARHIARP